jgi:hypothetical protein
MKKIRTVLAIFLLFQFAAAYGQKYKTAGGIRIDNGVHLTVQQYLTDGWTLEGILHTSIGSDDLGLTLLGEKHHKIIFRGTNLYTGAGFHYYGLNRNPRDQDAVVEKNVAGLSFIGGVEMSVGRINFAIDWKPELHLTGEVHPFDWNGASLSVRYIFAKRERKKIKDWKFWDKFNRRD